MKIIFITGKGGTGKTRYSIFLARQYPNATLSEFARGLEKEAKKMKGPLPPLHFFSRDDLVEDFLAKTLHWQKAAQWIVHNKIFQTLLQLAPNLYEILLLHQWIQLSESENLIVDAPSTGHFIALFESAKTAHHLFDGGKLKTIAEESYQKLCQGTNIEVHLISLPEVSALKEMEELHTYLASNYPSITVKKILNRFHRPPQNYFSLSQRLSDLAFKRPKLEMERIQNDTFDGQMAEGGSLSL